MAGVEESKEEGVGSSIGDWRGLGEDVCIDGVAGVCVCDSKLSAMGTVVVAVVSGDGG